MDQVDDLSISGQKRQITVKNGRTATLNSCQSQAAVEKSEHDNLSASFFIFIISISKFGIFMFLPKNEICVTFQYYTHFNGSK